MNFYPVSGLNKSHNGFFTDYFSIGKSYNNNCYVAPLSKKIKRFDRS